MNSKTDITDISIEELKKNNLDDVLHFAFERYWNKSALFGTKESCKTLLKMLYDVGVTEIGCLVDFGITEDKVIEGLDYLNELRKDFNALEREKMTEEF